MVPGSSPGGPTMNSKNQSLVYKYNAKILKFLNSYGISLQGPVALAVSGGSDSVFLATMLLSSKKPIVDKEKVRIIHVNHNWRKDSFKDEELVRSLGEKFGVPVDVFHVQPLKGKESPELLARNQRKEIFEKYPMVLTGHTSDDLFETVLWKTLQGKNAENGIKVKHKNEVRPLLSFSKEEMQKVLVVLGVKWVEDSTNHDGVLLRSKMRKNLMKVISQDFPDSKNTVVSRSLENQRK